MPFECTVIDSLFVVTVLVGEESMVLPAELVIIIGFNESIFLRLKTFPVAALAAGNVSVTFAVEVFAKTV